MSAARTFFRPRAPSPSPRRVACACLLALASSGAVSGAALAASSRASAPELHFRAATPSDRDGDGIDNAVDADDDNDLVADVDEPAGDADGDGVPNGFDADADNDGIADLVEAVTDRGLLARLDANGDGLLDADVALGPNGMADIAETAPESGALVTGRVDSDGDGVPDPYDLDSDNDGLADLVEAGGTDADGNARVDRLRDFDGDGRDDQLSLFPIVPRDTDGDGLFDFRDVDSDGDGASDRRESSGTDVDGDGVVDGFRDGDGDGLDDRLLEAPVAPLDTDGDRLADHLDDTVVPAGTMPSPGPSVAPPSGPPVSEPGPPTSGPEPEPPGTDPEPEPSTSEPPTVSEPAAVDGTASVSSATANDGAGRPVTGRAGNVIGGCSIASSFAAPSSRHRDPTLLALASVAIVLLAVRVRRRRARGRPVRVATALAGAVLGGCASFERPPDGGFDVDGLHVGLGVGASRLDADTDGTTFVAEGRGSTSAQLTLGATLAPWLDAEIRAADLGELTFAGGGRIGYQVADAGAVVRRARGPTSWFGRAGVGALFNDGDVEIERRNAVHLLLGAGVDVDLGRVWRVRLEASGHDVDALHADLGVVYRFGRAPRPASRTARATSSEPAPPVPLASRAPASGAAVSGGSAPERPTLAGGATGAARGLLIEPSPARKGAVRSDGGRSGVAGSSPLPDITPVPPRPDLVPAAGSGLALAAPGAGPTVPGEPAGGVAARSPDARDVVTEGADAKAPSDTTPPAVARVEPFDTRDYDIRFASGSDVLNDVAWRTIDDLARALSASPEIELAVVTRSTSETDARSDLLSRRRALAVVRALGEAGVDMARLRPEVRSGSTASGRDDDDRVQLFERVASGG